MPRYIPRFFFFKGKPPKTEGASGSVEGEKIKGVFDVEQVNALKQINLLGFDILFRYQ